MCVELKPSVNVRGCEPREMGLEGWGSLPLLHSDKIFTTKLSRTPLSTDWRALALTH